MRRLWALIFATCFLLTACGEEPEPEIEPEVYVPLRPVSKQIQWEDYVIESITPVTAFSSDSECVYIYPYNDSDKHITIEKFYTSGNYFFNTVLEECEQGNIQTGSGYILFTLPDCTTHAIVAVDSETALHIYGSVLSGYVVKVAEQFQ